jgi:uncharacterized protein YgfB (UPF0149 family)
MTPFWIVTKTIAPRKLRSPSIKSALLINSINLSLNHSKIANLRLTFLIFKEKLFKKKSILNLLMKKAEKKASLFKSIKNLRTWLSPFLRKLGIKIETKDQEKSSRMITTRQMKNLMHIHMNLSKRPIKCHLSSQLMSVYIITEELWPLPTIKERE